jgi:large subunit ribosomal protein L21
MGIIRLERVSNAKKATCSSGCLFQKFEEVKLVYAIVETGGKQFRVEPGKVFFTERLVGKSKGDLVSFDKVLMVKTDDGKTLVGRPYLENVEVSGTVLEHGRARKVLVGKFRPRKNYRRIKGHRQWFTAVKIEKIEVK